MIQVVHKNIHNKTASLYFSGKLADIG